MSEMNEADRKLAQELLAAWDGSFANRPAIEQAVNSMSEDAVSMAQTARRLIAAELAAKALPDEDALVERAGRAIADHDMSDYMEDYRIYDGQARAAISAIRPHIAALQARAEAAEKLVYVPGVWQCAKCNFELIQSNLNARDGTVTARDTPGEKCPNCNSPLWRVTERERHHQMYAACERWWQEKQDAVTRAKLVEAENARLRDMLIADKIYACTECNAHGQFKKQPNCDGCTAAVDDRIAAALGDKS
ncbi:hypothetical protein [Acidiphilium sp.]|uniref:hypothetical protein n=1 Tax=Acidiphilium sp. TaxID=527 RepID=UPI002C023557|nr:hypothetical protein [Acidiphilium sp.]HQT62795.1 hypothetical protein [Acidiphilium sp.]